VLGCSTGERFCRTPDRDCLCDRGFDARRQVHSRPHLPPALAPLRGTVTAFLEGYLAAQLAGDRREALRLLVEDGLGRGASVLELQAGVIQAAQARSSPDG